MGASVIVVYLTVIRLCECANVHGMYFSYRYSFWPSSASPMSLSSSWSSSSSSRTRTRYFQWRMVIRKTRRERVKDIIKCLISDALDPIPFRISPPTLSVPEVTPSLRRLCHYRVYPCSNRTLYPRDQISCKLRVAGIKSNLTRLVVSSNCIH